MGSNNTCPGKSVPYSTNKDHRTVLLPPGTLARRKRKPPRGYGYVHMPLSGSQPCCSQVLNSFDTQTATKKERNAVFNLL